MITLLQRRKKPQSSLVTMTFEIWSPKNMYNPGRMLDIWAKNEVDTTIGIGGVRGQTDRHTDRGPTAIIV